MRRWAWVVVVWAGCGTVGELDEEPVVASEPVDVEAAVGTSACGETFIVDMQLAGRVLDTSGTPVADADVWLEQRDWGAPQVHGEGVTGADGSFSFPVRQLPIIEGCWGIGPQFYAVAEGGGFTGEHAMNMTIVEAWMNETFLAESVEFAVDEPAF